MTELDEVPCASLDPHEPHDFPLVGLDWDGDPVWHCPGVATELEIATEWLPGTSAAAFRQSLRSTFLVVGFPAFMFGLVLHLWAPALLIFFAGMLAVMVTLDVVQRARRLNAIRRINQGELPE